MKNIYLFIILLFTVNNMIAQDPNNHWELGASDLNFTTNPPTVSNIPISINGGVGSASISDDNGDLLFYTDGRKIWNKNHQVMEGNPYGIGYGSPYYMTQKAVIVPHPGNSNQYYVFTTENEQYIGESTYPGYSYKYFIVDFGDPVYPLGKVLTIYENDLRTGQAPYGNPIMETFTFRPLTAVKNATNDGYFLIGMSGGASSSTILAYKITSTGLDATPIQSTITNDIGFSQLLTPEFEFLSYGTIKFTPDNTRLGILVMVSGRHLWGYFPPSYSARFCTLSFNNATGVFSNFALVDDYPSSSVPGISDFEFSADSQKVYLLKDKIYVKNLLNLSTSPRDLGDFSNPSSIPTGFGYMQRDKYGNILIASTGSINDRNKYIHKINNQNSYTNSSVELNHVYLNNNAYPSGYALPQLVPELVEPCLADVLVTSAVNTGTDKKQASNTITASNVVNTGAGAIYHAATSVRLSSGFHAKAGSTFRGYIEGCSGNYAARMAGSSENEDQLEDIVEKKSIAKLYPNPNKGVFTISIDETVNLILLIEIYNVYGKMIQTNTIDAKDISKEFNLSDIPAGIYFVKISGTDISETVKFIKE